MILEKLKNHSGKIMFFFINSLLLVAGFMYLKQKDLEGSFEDSNALTSSLEKEALRISLLNAQALRDGLENNRKQKLESVENNPEIIIKKETVAVTKVIPGATREIKVSSGTTSKTSSKNTTSTKSTKTS